MRISHPPKWAQYALPFLVWCVIQNLLFPNAANYAIRTAATTVAGIACLAWARREFVRFIHGVRIADVAAGLVVGLVVCAVWVLPEYSDFYRTWLEYPIGRIPPTPSEPPYAPGVCGWPLTIAKLVGSAFVIAPAEEIFFRSFLYRRLQGRDFTNVPLSRFDASAFMWTVLLFTLEHDRPLVAALAGAAYGLLAIRRGIGAAIAAHVVTNLALAVHVIMRGEWWFW